MFIASVVPITLINLIPTSSLVGILLIAIYLYYTVKVILTKSSETSTYKTESPTYTSKRKVIVKQSFSVY